MMVRNYKLGTPTGTLNSGTGDNRNIYTAGDQGANNTYVFTNTNVGYQFNITFQAQQTLQNGSMRCLVIIFLLQKMQVRFPQKYPAMHLTVIQFSTMPMKPD